MDQDKPQYQQQYSSAAASGSHRSGHHGHHNINPEHFADMNHRPHRPELDVDTAQHLAHQEQGLIAAAHRSDRPIESRIESAHRASELHFERTGRKLLVTREGLEKGEHFLELSKWESNGRPGAKKSQGAASSAS